MCLPVFYPDNTEVIRQKRLAETTQNRINLMKKHGHNIYSEEHWKFFMEWYRNYHPNRTHYY